MSVSIRVQQRLALGLVALTALGLVSWPFGPFDAAPRLGEVQPTSVVAEFDFPLLKDVGALESERAGAAGAVAAVVVRADSSSEASFARMRALSEQVRVLRRPASRDAAAVTEVELPFSPPTLMSLLLGDRSDELLAEADRAVREILSRGWIGAADREAIAGFGQVRIVDALGEVLTPRDRLPDDARVRELLERRAAAGGLSVTALTEVVHHALTPNLRYDAEGTATQVREARDAVPIVEGLVRRGERIVAARERITPDQFRALRSYHYWRGERGIDESWWRRLGPALGDVLLVGILLCAFVAYLWFHERWRLEQPDQLWLLAGLEALVLALATILVQGFSVPPLLVPVATLSILATLFFDDRVGMAATVLPIFLVGLVADGGTPFFAVVGLGSLGAVLLTPRVRERAHVYSLLLTVPAVHLLVLLALTLAEGGPLSSFLRNGFAAIASPFLAAALALLLLPVLEGLFRRSTALSLLELSDPSRPLLRRLLAEAPGTYHHSMLVGNLAAAAAQAIGANELLTRVIGYYHDIGKLAKPDYFTENIPVGATNPHDRLNPSMSRLLLESHVREGIALAASARLSREIVQGIREHHGVGSMRGLWRRALEREPEARAEDFVYPGPRPSSKESALVLLANEVESSARILEDPSPSRVKGMVLRVVQENLENGNLDESGFTLSEIARIRDVFTHLLSGAFGARVAAARGSSDV